MSAYNKLGVIAYVADKLKTAVELYEVAQLASDPATKDQAMYDMATKLAEAVAIGIPLALLDKLITKTGLDRVFDSMSKNVTFQQYLKDQVAAKNIRDFTLGQIGEFGLHQLRDWVIANQILDPIFDAVSGNFTSATLATAPVRVDPLTFDLDNDGLETSGINASNPILFDHDADGIKTASGWLNADDAFLVLDKNANGTIDTGRELFGDAFIKSNGQLAADGFDALRDLDANLNGKIDANDAPFAHLRLWRDLNQDGVSQSNELFTLASQNIAAINVASTEHSRILANGNQLADLGSFIKTDGSSGTLGEVTGHLGDIDLVQDTFHSQFSDHLDTGSVADLPDMHGAGQVRDLREAANDYRWRKAA